MSDAELLHAAAQDRRIERREMGAQSLAKLVTQYVSKRTSARKKATILDEARRIVTRVAESEIMEYRARLREMSEEIKAAEARARKAEYAMVLEDHQLKVITRVIESAIAKLKK